MPKVLEKNKVMMRIHVGEAETKSETLHLSTTLNGAPVIGFEDGTIVYWEWEELINQAIKLKNS